MKGSSMQNLSLLYNNENVTTIVKGDKVYFKSSDVYKYLGVSKNTWNDHMREWSDIYVQKMGPNMTGNISKPGNDISTADMSKKGSPDYTANAGSLSNLRSGNNISTAEETKKPVTNMTGNISKPGKGGNNKDQYYLTEAGLYRACSIGKTEMCEKFRDWVFGEVLPSIRKTGTYSLDNMYAMSMKSITDENRLMKKELIYVNKTLREVYDILLAPGRVSYKKVTGKLLNITTHLADMRKEDHYVFWKRNNPTAYGLDKEY